MVLSPQMRQPRLAEMVADALRDRILAGELRVLPPQDELLATYGVSRPSLREALSILEIEGLITVRRGRLGGAEVHPPSRDTAAYMLALLLQSVHAKLADVGDALRRLEPVCAGLCAERSNRRRSVLPKLRAVQGEMRDAVDDPLAFVDAARRFHETLVERCGNVALIELVGMLERAWSAHELRWAERAASSGRFPSVVANRLEGVRAHDRIVHLIDEGDSAGVVRACGVHLDKSQIWALRSERRGPISARLLREAGR